MNAADYILTGMFNALTEIWTNAILREIVAAFSIIIVHNDGLEIQTLNGNRKNDTCGY